MEHEGLDVDISVLTALIELRKQQDLLDSYCQRAEELRSRVDSTVYDRVVHDYSTRRRALEEEAAPLKTRARAEYRKLRLRYAEVQRTHATARLDKEEVEFRHTIGEIDEASLAERIREPDEILSTCSSEMTALDEQEALFREACPDLPVGDEALELIPAPVDPASEEPRGDTVAAGHAADEVDSDATREVSGIIESKEGEPAPAAAAVTPVRQPSAASVSSQPPDTGEQTFIVPRAALVSDEDDGQAINYRLAAVNYIGRSSDNQLQLSRPGVSRRHAVITATSTGYTIRDLSSQNGTYINGDRVTEGPLNDGDRISIGQVNLAFRTAVNDARSRG